MENLHLSDTGAGDQFAPEFLKTTPNNRIPAITDPDGPDGPPLKAATFCNASPENTGQFGGLTERDWIAVDQWLIWQVAGAGPDGRTGASCLENVPNMDLPQHLPDVKKPLTRGNGTSL